jgi:hypothetical protein
MVSAGRGRVSASLCALDLRARFGGRDRGWVAFLLFCVGGGAEFARGNGLGTTEGVEGSMFTGGGATCGGGKSCKALSKYRLCITGERVLNCSRSWVSSSGVLGVKLSLTEYKPLLRWKTRQLFLQVKLKTLL